MSDQTHFDFIVIGSGPAGQKAAVQAAKAGKSVALIEGDRQLGGACVYRGTIPSKTLRENAVRIRNLRHHSEFFEFEMRSDLEMTSLIQNLENVLDEHDHYISEQMQRNGIVRVHGRAAFVDPHSIEVRKVGGVKELLRGDHIVIATGSFPRHIPEVAVDHEYVFDSDSILSKIYLPKSLVVLGGGVIASEYASIFASLGVKVTMIDRYPRPLGFLDSDLTDRFLDVFSEDGGEFIGEATLESVRWDGLSQVVTRLADGREILSDKVLLAAGRVANVKGLALENAGLALNDRGVIDVDAQCRTAVKHIFAAGDVIGPPSLASASMEQGRRAVRAALGEELDEMTNLIPMGIYSIPELSTVGLDYSQAADQQGSAMVGVARFNEIARGQISGNRDGLLKLVTDGEGRKLLGVQIVGAGATELIHIGQMGLLNHVDIDMFVENIFNFPTSAEAYRVAALDIVGQRERGKTDAF